MMSTGTPRADSAAMAARPLRPVSESESGGGPKGHFQLGARRFRL
jgi:hypothetical protein